MRTPRRATFPEATARRQRFASRILVALALSVSRVNAQPITTPWGNVTGIEIDGERMAFEGSLRAVAPDWSGFVQSSKYNWEGHPSFTLEGKTTTCSHFLQGTHLNYTTRVTDTGRGTAQADLQVELGDDLPLAGAFYCVNLPAGDYAGARFELIGADRQPLPVLTDNTGALKDLVRQKAKGFRVIGAKRSLEVMGETEVELVVRQDLVDQPDYLNDPNPRMIFVRQDPNLRIADFQVYFPVLPATAKAGATAHVRYLFRADGLVDREPVAFNLDARQPGRLFAGIGGNFRMQFPDLDAQVVDYCFEHLNVTWGRIAFPWNEWQPDEDSSSADKAKKGGLSRYFYAQVEMARKLAERRIPMILSIWVPPQWAVDSSRKIPKGVKLDSHKLQKIADSIADYIVFLKANYGAEPVLFSFNETDYGVEVHQDSGGTCGGQSGHRLRVRSPRPGHEDAPWGYRRWNIGRPPHGGPNPGGPEPVPIPGAISFHNYHGLTPADLKAWADSAHATNLPLLADEGGADSAAHRYPLVWAMPWFAQLETDQYVRIGAACQPLSILPWQLNADYSLLAGGGTYGDQGPLRPTQRFWSLKQLGSLSGAFWLPVSVDRPNISCAALGAIARGAYAIHITNNGASRTATVSGIPAGARNFHLYVTDAVRGMQLMSVRNPVDGKVTFLLEAQTFTSLVSEPITAP